MLNQINNQIDQNEIDKYIIYTKYINNEISREKLLFHADTRNNLFLKYRNIIYSII